MNVIRRLQPDNAAALVDRRLAFINPKTYTINGLNEVADFILNNKERHYFIIGDYDVDGVMATSGLTMILRALGHDVEYYAPKRFTDGYGANVRIIDMVPPNSVIILVDNGIVAFDAINAAKAKGCTVIILDHHLGAENGALPNADIIIDPNAIAGQCDFTAYCGAGLVHKLAQILPLPVELQEEIEVLAAYATIADQVSLTGENWLLTQKLNKAYLNIGLNALCEKFTIWEPDEGDAGFKICPALNAPGRLLDDGAMLAISLILEEDEEKATELASKLHRLNEDRKGLVDVAMDKALALVARDGFDKAICIVTDIPVGIVGIVAGRLTEKFHVPAFVLSDAGNGIIKGSARTWGDNHLKKVLDKCKPVLLKYGGHAAAAGLSLEAKNFELFKRLCSRNCVLSDDAVNIYYDINCKPDDIAATIAAIKQAAPYGQDNPPISIKIGLALPSGETPKFKALGKYKKLFSTENIDVLCFDNIPEEATILSSNSIDVIGYPSINHFRGKETLQVEGVYINFNK